MLDDHVVSTALDRVGFDQFDAADIGRFKFDLQLILTIGQRSLTRQQGHQGFVGGESAPGAACNQAGLRYIDTVGAFVQQNKALFLVRHVLVFFKGGVNQGSTFAVKSQGKYIGVDHYALFGG